MDSSTKSPTVGTESSMFSIQQKAVIVTGWPTVPEQDSKGVRERNEIFPIFRGPK
jgi:hypothetical protein